MREIFFRGKPVNKAFGDEFIYGSLGVIREGLVAIYNCLEFTEDIRHFVIPETVGQYTGSIDKNGTKIFEGDIVEFYFFDKGHKNTKTMLIEWRDSGFCMRELFRDYRLADDFTIIDEKIFTYRNDIRNGIYLTNNVYFVEVIGNIHDNPKLLKECEDDKVYNTASTEN